MNVEAILRSKGRQVTTIAPDATIAAAVQQMTGRGIGALVVSGDGVEVEGIVSERDVVRRLNEDETALDQPVSSIMSAQVHTCERSQPVHDLMVAMTERRIRHVPVVEDGRLVGIVSIGDVVKSRMGELEFERDQLDSYVHTGQS
jgi:CBS domain-containing protein